MMNNSLAPVMAAGLSWAFGRGSMPGLLTVAALALLAVLAAVWLVRARAARRRRAALNAYAERELARPRRGKVPRTAL